MSNEQTLTCDVCGKAEARIRRVTRSYGKGDDLLIIEDIPVINCSNCGESYMTAETLHAVERIKQDRKKVAVRRQVEVASFT